MQRTERAGVLPDKSRTSLARPKHLDCESKPEKERKQREELRLDQEDEEPKDESLEQRALVPEPEDAPRSLERCGIDGQDAEESKSRRMSITVIRSAGATGAAVPARARAPCIGPSRPSVMRSSGREVQTCRDCRRPSYSATCRRCSARRRSANRNQFRVFCWHKK
jgi:hypothetical protein